MKKQFSIGSKIAFSVAIVVTGYAVSMVFGTWQGQRAERRLTQLSSDAVPSALNTQAALFNYEDAVKRHEEALLTGEADGLIAVNRLLETASTLLTEVSALRTSFG